MLPVQEPYLQQLLNSNGFFVIPFINKEIVQQLQSIYTKHFSQEKMAFYSTSFHDDLDLKKQVNAEILQLLTPILQTHFTDYKLLGTSFLKKEPNENNPLPLHQDWTVTDEEKIWLLHYLDSTSRHQY
ncbi:MAG: hypothetical protein R2807_05935 [Chitinophagales bacterium]